MGKVPVAGARMPGWHWVAIALLLAYLVWNSLYYAPFTVDDAFITFRYARNLAEGHGAVYNPGEHVEGYSSFSWLLVSAALLKLRLPLLLSIKVVGVVCALGLALSAHRLVRRLLVGVPGRDAAALATLALIATHTSVAVWSQAGLETVFYALVLVLAVDRFEAECARAKPPLPWSAVLVAVVLMTRPEAPLYFLYFGLRFVAIRRAPGFRTRAASWALVVVILVGAYEFWTWITYGSLLPNTFSAKIGALDLLPMMGKVRGSRYINGFLQDHGPGFWVLLGLGALGTLIPFSWARVPRPLALQAPIVAGLAFIVYAGSDWMPRHRFFVPFLPFLLAAIAVGMLRLMAAVRGRRVAVVALTATVTGAGLHYGVTQSFGDAESLSRLKGHGARIARGWWPAEVPERMRQRHYPFANLAMEVVQSVAADEWIAVPDIGFVGFFSDNPLWDLAGLVTPMATAVSRTKDEAAVLAAVDDLLARKPALIVERTGAVRPSVSYLCAVLRRDPRLQRDYDRDGPFPPFYRWVHRRRDAPGFDAEAQLARALTRVDHPGNLLQEQGLAREPPSREE